MPYRRWNPGCPCCESIVTITTGNCFSTQFIPDLRYSSDSFAVPVTKLYNSICRVVIAGGIGNAADINGTYDLPNIGVGIPSFPVGVWRNLAISGDYPGEIWSLQVTHRYYHDDINPRYQTTINRVVTGGTSDTIFDSYKCLEDQNNHVRVTFGSALPTGDIANVRMTISEIIIP